MTKNTFRMRFHDFGLFFFFFSYLLTYLLTYFSPMFRCPGSGFPWLGFSLITLITLSRECRECSLLSPPLGRALPGSDGATRRHHPSQGHGSSPDDFYQMQRCMPDSRDSIVPGQFSFLPGFDAELPAVPVMLHPHQLHSSTSRELIAYPWWQFVSTRTGKPQDSSQKPHDSS